VRECPTRHTGCLLHDLLVASTLCTDRGCQAHRRFDATHSSSYVASSQDADITLTHGQGSIVAQAGSDKVRPAASCTRTRRCC